MDKPINIPNVPLLKTYKVSYVVECFVEAFDQQEAIRIFDDGGGEDCENIKVQSIEEMTGDHFFPRLATEDKPIED